MNTIDELDGEIRRALIEVGDAAGLPTDYDVLTKRVVGAGVDANRRRSAVWIPVGAAAALSVALVASVATSPGRGGHQISPATEPGSTIAQPVPVQPSSIAARDLDPATAGLGPDTPAEARLREIVTPLLPAGFRLVYLSAAPLYAVAYDPEGVRLQVLVSIDGAASARRDLGTTLHPTPQGDASADGTTVLTSAGDVVSAIAKFADARFDLPDSNTQSAVAASIVTGVVEALDPDTRVALRGGDPELLGTGSFAEGIDALLEAFVGSGVSGPASCCGSSGDISRRIETMAGATVLEVSAVRTNERRPDAIVHPDDRRIAAFRWAAGWQIVVGAWSLDGTAVPWDEASILGLLDQLAATAEQWRPVTAGVDVCGSYVLDAGDSDRAIADRFGITVDQLLAANPDFVTVNYQGAEIALPCGAREQTRLADVSGLDSFTLASGNGYGFKAMNASKVASGSRVWVIEAGTDTGPGHSAMLRFGEFDRTTGELLSDPQISLMVDGPAGCAGALEMIDDPSAPLDAIPFRCTVDGSVATLDVFSGLTTDFDR